MTRNAHTLLGTIAMAGFAAILPGQSVPAQTASSAIPAGDWPLYSRDYTSDRYSPLDQITKDNVTSLQRIWETRTQPGEPGARNAFNSEVTPIAVGGILYANGGSRVDAIDGDTGEILWSYEAPGRVNNRAVGYWPGDEQNPPRILFTSAIEDRGPVLAAVNANTGTLDPGFGDEGFVDIKANWGGAPYVYKNMIIMGSDNGENTLEGPPGDADIFSAQTGEHLWSFDSTPGPGDFGYDTWLDGEWKGTGVNPWGWYFTIDTERNLLFIPFGSPGGNYWGGNRHGAGLFGNSLVAVNAETGEYVWHFQIVHHDLWDVDLPAAPSLFDIHRDGKTIPALAIIGKNALMFILNRETGEPIYGVEERAVPQGEVPEEWYSPTQPFPVKPPPLARTSFTPDDLVTAEDTTPEHAAACRELFEKGGFYNEGMYTPFPFHKEGDEPRTALQFPGNGGPNWGGTAADPTTGYVYVTTRDAALSGWIEKKVEGGNYGSGNGSPQPYDRGSIEGHGPYHGFAVMGMQCQRPPWARLFAVDANTGEIAWQIILGLEDRLPEGKQRVGKAGSAGPSLTATGLVLAPAGDQRLRALDAMTGEELWVEELGGNINANVMVYAGKSGREYIGAVVGGSVVAYALPE